jgi:hypothetical protein
VVTKLSGNIGCLSQILPNGEKIPFRYCSPWDTLATWNRQLIPLVNYSTTLGAGYDVAEASQRLKDFSGHYPADVVRVSEKPFKAGLVIGTLDGVPYTTIRDGKTESYVHEFRENARPLLVASSDGRSLRVVGGRFQFTEAGIVDD